jgi:hypothetical protein
MGHSTTVFGGVGFTAKDWKLELWLNLLAREVDKVTKPPSWLMTIRDYWRQQAKLSINGCIDAGLDAFLTDRQRVAVVRNLAQQVFNSLLHFGERVPHDFLNDVCQPPPSCEWSQDVETELFLGYGRALLKLLDGKMTHHEFA